MLRVSHLLYLHSFAEDRFVSVFGGGNPAHIDAFAKSLASPGAPLSARAKDVVVRAVVRGLDGAARPAEEQQVLDCMVDLAVTSKRFGIAATPISPMGASGKLFDEYGAHFRGRDAARLYQVLQRGRNYESAVVLLSPSDVVRAAALLTDVRSRLDAGRDHVFVEELVTPFVETAKKAGRAIFGSWG